MDQSNNCGHGAEIGALLRRQQELVTQLRALILPQLFHDVGSSGSAELALQLFDDVIGCNTSVVSKLFSAIGRAAVEPIDDKSLVRKNSTGGTTAAVGDIDDRLEEQAISPGRKRRRNNGKRSRSLVTNVPDYDGHQWRKYGQKSISGSQHARSYYRCTHTERNCLATKTIQQQDKDDGSANYSSDANEDQAAKYTVVYYGDHTCKAGDIMSTNITDRLPNLVDTDRRSSETARATAEISEFETELDVAALLEVYNNSLLNWETAC